MFRLSLRVGRKKITQNVALSAVLNLNRKMGGYIEDSQLSTLGLEIFQELHGINKLPSINFIIPKDDEMWPVHLWNYELGKGVEKYLSKYFSSEKLPSTPSESKESEQKERFNKIQSLYSKKVVDNISLKPGEKVALCRCWQSAKFPLCDGSHGKHNKATGDNLGPVFVTVALP